MAKHSDRSTPETPTDAELPASTDAWKSEDLAEIASHVEALAETAAELRELGANQEFPAVERNAARVEAVVSILEQNLPRELHEE